MDFSVEIVLNHFIGVRWRTVPKNGGEGGGECCRELTGQWGSVTIPQHWPTRPLQPGIPWGSLGSL